MNVSANELAEIITRALNRCEYCKMHQALQGATFHVEHIRPLVLGGSDSLENLAWACPSCNLFKGSRVGLINEQTGEVVPLFNPRQDQWEAHFGWRGEELVGLTEIGRSTVTVLQLNSERRILIRQAERHFALFPP